MSNIDFLSRLIPVEAKKASDGVSVIPEEIEILQTGDWNTPNHGKFTVTAGDLDEYVQNFKSGGREVPDLFTRDAEPVAADIMLRADIERCVRCAGTQPAPSSVGIFCVSVAYNAHPIADTQHISQFSRSKLGRFEIYAGGGQFLHADREYMRTTLQEISGQTSRHAFIYRQLYEFTPCRLLQGGKAFVDAPGTGDKTPLHRGHLKVRARIVILACAGRRPAGARRTNTRRTHSST